MQKFQSKLLKTLVFSSRNQFSGVKASVALMKQLREQTGSPMMQCKKALELNENDIEKAKTYLKEKGLSQAGKYSQKETREGLVGIKLDQEQKKATLIELNCQTDFVARTEAFLKFSNVFLTSLLEKDLEGSKTFSEEAEISEYCKNNILNEQVIPHSQQTETIDQVQTQLISHLQENITLRRFARLQADNGYFGSYVHNTVSSGLGLKSCLVELELKQNQLEGENAQKIQQLASDLALQILGNKPSYITRKDIPQDVLQSEEEQIRKGFGDKLQGKPEQVQKNMVQGKMKKFYEDQVLMDQQFIFEEENSKRTIEKYIKEVEKAVGDKISVKQHLLWSCK